MKYLTIIADKKQHLLVILFPVILQVPITEKHHVDSCARVHTRTSQPRP